MIALLTTIKPPGWNFEVAAARCRESAPNYRSIPGLRHKTFWIDEDKGEVGGFYLFRDRASAEAFLSSRRWRITIPEAWGVKADTRLMSVPAVVDNDLPEDRGGLDLVAFDSLDS